MGLGLAGYLRGNYPDEKKEGWIEGKKGWSRAREQRVEPGDECLQSRQLR
ncbi:MAG: hypothetical protein GYA24_16445, partial [Candidatus Lokiarchaeota archaeon]|nr:hypothetical protein [Candidatus Lokiarchaeota archaeon]